MTDRARFDAFMIVDWSAANAPRQGPDSIWIAEVTHDGRRARARAPLNPATREEAMAMIGKRLEAHIAAGRRVFVGFDFPLGYPAGVASALGEEPRWDAFWRRFGAMVVDGADNRSNRFAVAQALNEKLGEAHYWGRPHQHKRSAIPVGKPDGAAFRALEYRIVETWALPAKSVWQLAYNGAVGSQAMLGMARLCALRDQWGSHCAVWPFETRWAARLDAPVVIGEVYPSMMAITPREGEVKDAAQVRTLSQLFARLDRQGAFSRLLQKPEALRPPEDRKVLREEGWIVGAGHSIPQS